MASAPKKISLLPQEGFDGTSLGRVLAWALSAGRIIVIVTELIVIVAFLSRFWFDRTLTDLNETIKAKAKIVQAQSALETEFRNVQSRISQVGANDLKEKKIKSIEDILVKVPAEARLDKISSDEKETTITGVSLSEAAIQGFMAQLESLNVGNVSLTQISTNPQGGLKFSIAIK